VGLISFLENNLLSCQWKSMGVECMGCGFQRSVIHLLKGEFSEAFSIYPAIFTLILMIAFLGLHIKYNFVKGHKVLLWLFLLNLGIIIINYIFKFL
jgi:uncharacterized membrane protein YoaK (UPF0700 family)